MPIDFVGGDPWVARATVRVMCRIHDTTPLATWATEDGTRDWIVPEESRGRREEFVNHDRQFTADERDNMPAFLTLPVVLPEGTFGTDSSHLRIALSCPESGCAYGPQLLVSTVDRLLAVLWPLLLSGKAVGLARGLSEGTCRVTGSMIEIVDLDLFLRRLGTT